MQLVSTNQSPPMRLWCCYSGSNSGFWHFLGTLACVLTKFLDMTFISGLVHSELGAETITDERRLQLVRELERGTFLQFRVNEFTWWVVLVGANSYSKSPPSYEIQHPASEPIAGRDTKKVPGLQSGRH